MSKKMFGFGLFVKSSEDRDQRSDIRGQPEKGRGQRAWGMGKNKTVNRLVGEAGKKHPSPLKSFDVTGRVLGA